MQLKNTLYVILKKKKEY